jgi:hypothetical protein
VRAERFGRRHVEVEAGRASGAGQRRVVVVRAGFGFVWARGERAQPGARIKSSYKGMREEVRECGRGSGRETGGSVGVGAPPPGCLARGRARFFEHPFVDPVELAREPARGTRRVRLVRGEGRGVST